MLYTLLSSFLNMGVLVLPTGQPLLCEVIFVEVHKLLRELGSTLYNKALLLVYITIFCSASLYSNLKTSWLCPFWLNLYRFYVESFRKEKPLKKTRPLNHPKNPWGNLFLFCVEIHYVNRALQTSAKSLQDTTEATGHAGKWTPAPQ